MNAHVSVITLGARDLARSRRFYAEELGWPVRQEDDNWVCFLLGGGSTAFALYPWDELAEDAGVPAQGTGFRGVTLTYNVRSEERVDAVLAEAERAGGAIVQPARPTQWGGYSGYFADPEGYLLGSGDRRDATTLRRVAAPCRAPTRMKRSTRDPDAGEAAHMPASNLGSRFDLPVTAVGGLLCGALSIGLAVLFGSWANVGSDVGPTAATLDEAFSQLFGAMLGLVGGAAAVAAFVRWGSRIANGVLAGLLAYTVVLVPVLIGTAPSDVSIGDSISTAVLVLVLLGPAVVLGAVIGSRIRAALVRLAVYRDA